MRRVVAVLGVLVARTSGASLQLAANLVLSRTIGATGLGVYALYDAWHRFAATGLGLGLPASVMRSIARSGDDRASPLDVLRSAARSALPLALATVVAAAVLGIWATRTGRIGSDLGIALTVSGIAGALFLYLRILVEAIKALGGASLGLILEFAVVPSVVIAGVGVLLLLGRNVPVPWVIGIHTVGLAAAAALSAVVLARRIRSRGGAHEPCCGDGTRLISFGLWGISVLATSYSTVPFLLLPFLAEAADVGRFSVAFRIVAVAGTILGGLASHFGPRFSAAKHAADGRRLGRLLTLSQGASLALYAPVFLACVVFPEPILGIFGDEFRAGADLLRILAIGQLVNAATGLAGIFVQMVDREAEGLRASLVSLVVLVGLCAGLGVAYGPAGVALGYATGLALQNLLMIAIARRSLRAAGTV